MVYALSPVFAFVWLASSLVEVKHQYCLMVFLLELVLFHTWTTFI